MLRYALLLLPLVSLCQAARFCSYFGNRAPSPQPSLTNCTWYREESCCLQEEISALFPRVSPPVGASQRCRNYVTYLMCFVCAPTQSNFYIRQRLTVCESFCNDFFDACRDARLDGQTIASQYASGSAFCRDRKYIVSTNQETCFTLDPGKRTLSASNRVQATLSLVQLFALASLVCGILPGGRGNAALLLTLAMLFFIGGEAAFSKKLVLDMADAAEAEIKTLASVALDRSELQRIFDRGMLTNHTLNASLILDNIKNKLEAITGDLRNAASKLALSVSASTYNDQMPVSGQSLDDLGATVYQDANFQPPRVKLSYVYNG